ncbi:hypothetical protein SLINC_8029 [Streptomyces lincolnensis]|uniref:Secreted protein n=1 Tax=Streptomyces lincolnensis TaxID=1915 RepID=A0A1B1MNW9_STRLN|nr:hypothetical protein [Streptomyces lincolnensis]ANS70253.1 hypothetical protein SLINC_8029 [Streptomyces lincolnensis]
MFGRRIKAAMFSTALATVLAGTLAAPSAQAAPSAAAAECGVRAHDGRLWCGNHADAPTRYRPVHESDVNGLLKSSFSYFTCWSPGGLHGGGNTTWYRTVPDWSVDGTEGYVPADWVFTPSWFDADPSKYGLRRC